MSSLTIVIGCWESPARLAGATCPIATLTVAPASELRLWDHDARTLRFVRDLAGVVTIETSARWGDFAIEYAALIAQTFDGIVSVADEILGEVEIEPEMMTERELGITWRLLDDRAHAALVEYERVMKVKQLAWEATTAVGPNPLDRKPARDRVPAVK